MRCTPPHVTHRDDCVPPIHQSSITTKAAKQSQWLRNNLTIPPPLQVVNAPPTLFTTLQELKYPPELRQR